MDLLQLIGKREVQKILSELKEKRLTAADLNDLIVIRDNMCSTSSLYRRLTELSLTGIINKLDQHYSLTDDGKTIMQEFNKKFDLQLDPKLRAILIQFLNSKQSVSDLLKKMKISPNELTRSLHYLHDKKYLVSELKHHTNLIEEKLDKDGRRSKRRFSSSRGRPRRVYKLTKKGKKSLDDLEEFEESLK